MRPCGERRPVMALAPYQAAHRDCEMKSKWAFRPCAISSKNRVLRRAWTEAPSDGEPAFPRTLKLAHANASYNPWPDLELFSNNTTNCHLRHQPAQGLAIR